MTDLLLTTKLYIPPSRPDLIQRAQLMAYLDEGLALGRKLVLVSAPVGFGKTTLISEWVHYRSETFPPCRCAWVTLDQGDNHLPRFIAYLVAACQKIYADLGCDLLPALQYSQPPPAEVVLTELLNEIAAFGSGDPRAHYLLVLDDYQEITTPAVHEAVIFLLEQLPIHWHLVLTTRVDPVLPLARLRARNQLTELRAADLRFSETEVTNYLQHVTKINYTQSDIAALTVRTEGWIAGLQLLGLLIQETIRRHSLDTPKQIIRNFTGAHRYVIDYLTDEVLDQQPAVLRNFLLRTSLLDRLTAALCDAMLELEQNSRAILTELETHNLFIMPLDEKRQWYRYHRLFADLLQTRLYQEVGTVEVARLHLRASDWFEQNGLITEALHHALAAADLDRAVAVIAAHGLAMIRRGAITTVQEWLKMLPPERVRTHPKLCIHLGWVLFHTYQSDEIESIVQSAERALEKPTFANAPDRAQLVEHIMALRISVAEIRQENATVVLLAQQALARITDDNRSARGTNLYFLGRALGNLGETSRGIEACLASVPCYRDAGVVLAAMGALSDAALFLLQLGKLRTAQRLVEDALRWAAEDDLLSLPASAQLLMILGQIYYARNELDTALEQLQQSISLAKYMLPLTAALAHLGVAQIQLANGNTQGATAALQDAEHLATYRTIVPPEATFLTVHRVRIWLMQGDLIAITQWVQQSGLSVEQELAYPNEQALIALARILVWRAQIEEQATDLRQAAILLTKLEQWLLTTERAGHLLEVLILQALLQAAEARWQDALATLTQALHLAEPEGYIRLFCDEGALMQQLLTRWLQQATAVPSQPIDPIMASRQQLLAVYVHRLLSAFRELEPTTTPGDLRHGHTPSPIATHLDLGMSSVATIDSTHQSTEQLTARELDVLKLMATGLDNREIADELTIAVSTVKTHINHIFAKLAVRSRIQAVTHAQNLRLIP